MPSITLRQLAGATAACVLLILAAFALGRATAAESGDVDVAGRAPVGESAPVADYHHTPDAVDYLPAWPATEPKARAASPVAPFGALLPSGPATAPAQRSAEEQLAADLQPLFDEILVTPCTENAMAAVYARHAERLRDPNPAAAAALDRVVAAGNLALACSRP